MRAVFTAALVLLAGACHSEPTTAVISLHRVCPERSQQPHAETLLIKFWEGFNTHGDTDPMCLERTPLASGRYVHTAEVISGAPDETYALRLVLNPAGVEVLNRIAAEHRLKRIAFVADDKVIFTATFVSAAGREVEVRGIGSAAFQVARKLNGK
jgi:preprotein translocase subunit SecD